MYDRFTHAAFASVYPDAAVLTADQFELWWRGLSYEEREAENQAVDAVLHPEELV